MTEKIIDISYWQGKISVENFKKVRADGIVGIIQRSGYTGQNSFSLNSDSTMVNNILNASKVGLSVGIYHYSQAISVSEAQKEAEYCLKLIKDYKTYITLPVFFDWEWGGRLSAKKANNLGKQKCTDICNAFCKVIADAGYKTGVYASLNVFQGYLYPAQIDNKYLIWVAQYNSKCSYDRKKYMWQYTSSGKVNGINGRVDMNYLYGDTPTPPTPTPSGYDGELPKLHITKSASEVSADAVTWSKWIANDNSFHYGYTTWAHHGGCYFCNTNTQIKGSHNGHEKKSYCCNPFVGSAYAHGGLDKYCLSLCKKGKNANFCWGSIEKGTFATLFKKVTLKKGNLKAGDVLSKTGHMAMYVGNEKLVEASTSDDDKPNSTKWNNSIRISAMRYGGFTDAYRYVGSVDIDHNVTYGDVSDDVKRLQEFLKWYGADITPDRIFGDKTLEAVKKFQKDMGITADGIFGSNSLAKAKECTKEITPPQPTKKPYSGTFPKLPARRYFKRGDKGMQVKYLQQFLNWYGKYGLVVDGVIGSKTIVAVEKFQKSEKLGVDGLFGKKCLAKAKQVKI